MGVDIAVIAVGWLALLWRLVPPGRLPLALQRLTVQPGSRADDVTSTVGFSLPAIGIMYLIIGWTEHQAIWLRMFWLLIGFLVAGVVAGVILSGPRLFVRQLLRRDRRRDTAENRTPPKGRVLQ